MIKTSWIFIYEFGFFHWRLGWLTVLHQVMEEHNSSFILIWFGESDDFIDTIVNGFVQLFGVVGGHNKDHSFTWSTCSIQEGVNRVSHVFRNVATFSASKESICFIDEQNHSVWLLLSPIKELIDFSNSHWT